ncbi:hypothetical protein KCV01_g5801, partial [Aureobasidium melanogenum]
MNPFAHKLLVALFVAVPAIATAQAASAATEQSSVRPVRCSVTDLDQFASFVAGKPTAVEFRAAYSCVQLVLPGDVTTMEMRYDNSRYFAQLDSHGRIVGGNFH